MLKCWLGLDLGTSSVKAVLVCEHGTLLGQGKSSYTPDSRHPGWSEQDPEIWWSACEQALLQSLSTKPVGAEVLGLGLCGQMHGTLLLDEEHRLLNPAVLWSDQRAYTEVKELREVWKDAGGARVTGGPIAAGFQLTTLQWFGKHHPELLACTAKVALPKDWLHWRLTGEWSSDPSDAAGTGLFDVQQCEWSSALLSAVGLVPEQLPPIAASTEIRGGLLAEWSRRWGLPEDLPVIVGAGDTPCSQVGAGALREGAMLLTLSSGGQLVRPLSRFVVDSKHRLHTGCTPFALEEAGFRWFQMGATLHAGQAVQWLWRLLGQTRFKSVAEWMPLAEQAKPGAGGLLFVPYLGGERTPHMDGAARGSWLGLTQRHGEAELLRSVLEGVIFSCMDAMAAFEKTEAPDTLLLAGGGAQSLLWSQMVADISGLPVRRLLTEEQSALGAAWLAVCATEGHRQPHPPQTWTEYAAPLLPREETREMYSELLGMYLEQYERQRPLYERLQRWE